MSIQKGERPGVPMPSNLSNVTNASDLRPWACESCAPLFLICEVVPYCTLCLTLFRRICELFGGDLIEFGYSHGSRGLGELCKIERMVGLSSLIFPFRFLSLEGGIGGWVRY